MQRRKVILFAITIAVAITVCRMLIGLLALTVFIAIAAGLISAALRGELGPPPPPTPIPSRTIIAATLPFKEHWRKGGLRLYHGIAPSGEYVGFIDYRIKGRFGWQRQYWLSVLRAANGERVWEADLPPPISLASLATDGKRLFVAVHWHIRAYDLATGKLLWRTPGSSSGYYYFQPQGEDVLVYSKEGVSINQEEQLLYRYDARTGDLKEIMRMVVSPDRWLVMRTPYADYWTDGERIWAQDQASSQLLWEREIRRRIEYPPILTDESMIYADGLPATLYAVDAISGVVLWTYHGPLVSNFVLSQRVLYGIRQDGALVGINPRTGKEVGLIRFYPSETQPGSMKYWVAAYWVAAYGNQVFVYFGDSQELIALGP